ncbi:putative NAD-dependent deacetylase [Clostridiales bacterium oral taxon 876 str. F0540]|nr:putative NAD-dependent deacetylase [Clostridiales bacterium oral taxon 876 str. F0540]
MCIDKLKQIIKNSSSIVFFGGAGVSTESNIPDFRSDNGLYKEHHTRYEPETILSKSFFINHTEDFFSFYKSKMIYKNAKPNKAHIALAKLEQIGKLKAVITQNIDGLHQLSGSKNVLELHGSIHRNHCIKCGRHYDLDYIINSTDNIPYCEFCGGIIKPDVVLYEENLDMNILSSATSYISKSDTLIVGGTSLAVYPAAGLINYYRGNNLILINKSETPYDSKANLIFHDSIGDILSSVI